MTSSFRRGRLGNLIGTALVAVASLGGVAACGGGGSGDAAAKHIVQANDALRGDWLLVDYRPEVALEPIMAQLLAVQIGKLQAHFDGAQVVAQGVGVNARRTYRITESDGANSRITFYDDTGMPYEITTQHKGNLLQFQALTAPWRGLGTLQRQ